MFSMDRTAFRVNTFSEADTNARYWRKKTPTERLLALNFLIRQAWQLPADAVLKMNRTAAKVKLRRMADVFNPDFRDFISALNKEQVEYILIGGYAVVLHGYSRTTGDMDVWVRPTSENYQKLVKAFTRFGMPVFDMTEQKFLATDQYDVFSFGVPPVAIDILTAPKGLEFTSAHKNSSIYSFENLSVRVIQYADLITAKKAAGRNRDLNDIEQLEKAHQEEE